MKFIATFLLALAALPASNAFALEDHAILEGRFEWIVPRAIRDQYPNGELNDAKVHYIPRVEVTRGGNGLFTMVMTLPTTLTGGANIQATYRQARPQDDDDDMRFVNTQHPTDVIDCSPGTDEWIDVNCYRVVGLKQQTSVSAQQRANYASARYEGTSLKTGMAVIAGAEPAGEISFVNASASPEAWIGRWSIQYQNTNGQLANGTMEIDGYTGIYRVGNQRGVIRRTFISDDDGSFRGSWEIGNVRGYFGFNLDGNAFTGQWSLEDDDAMTGSWSGRRQ